MLWKNNWIQLHYKLAIDQMWWNLSSARRLSFMSHPRTAIR